MDTTPMLIGQELAQHEAEVAVRKLLYQFEPEMRAGVAETPARVAKALVRELLGGYWEDPMQHMKVFEEPCSEMVLLKNVEFTSMCLVGSTFVETPRGRIPISHLRDGEWVYTFDEEHSQFVLAQCSNPRITQKAAKLVRVYTDKDTVICTPNHKFLTHDNGWKTAEYLTPGESIVALLRGVVVQNGVPRSHLRYGDKTLVPEHRAIMECILERELDKREYIHHLDGNPANNDPSNLECLSIGQHLKLHGADGRGPREAKRWKEMTTEERLHWENTRKEGIKKVLSDPVRRKAMLEKRAASVKKSWETRDKNRPNHKVIGVEFLDYTEDVWCMDVPRTHNFVANGMVVHNCEHHMLPFVGKAHIAYIPKNKVIGVSKLARILDCFARRLQIQERLCQQVTWALMEGIDPIGVACIIEAKHLCMSCRGVGKQQSSMVTSSLKGAFMDNASARQELYSLISL